MYLLIYATLAVTVQFFTNPIKSLLKDLPLTSNFFGSVHLTAPFYAIAVLGALWQIRFLKEIDRVFLIALHSGIIHCYYRDT
jgi:hypothetical protein